LLKGRHGGCTKGQLTGIFGFIAKQHMRVAAQKHCYAIAQVIRLQAKLKRYKMAIPSQFLKPRICREKTGGVMMRRVAARVTFFSKSIKTSSSHHKSARSSRFAQTICMSIHRKSLFCCCYCLQRSGWKRPLPDFPPRLGVNKFSKNSCLISY
jgi:hypothetical protein